MRNRLGGGRVGSMGWGGGLVAVIAPRHKGLEGVSGGQAVPLYFCYLKALPMQGAMMGDRGRALAF